ncbi:FG-GAP-like repeat-containing protein [Paenibacillus alvei]|uniref:FG-GAP-like repeat-containing protein n=1 Tax=Paenibacillus alvei TaxID=44250 RepID=A0ABT4E875_PAEAL|nr:FG-GAP-like repeat-containing protein [Paenibacillus alvei]
MSLSNGSGFEAYTRWIEGHGEGSSQQLVGDVNGDGKADTIVYFDNGEWWVSLSNGSGFDAYTRWIAGYGEGSSQQFVGDVNGDGKADSIVYFDNGEWWVSLSRGDRFGAFQKWRGNVQYQYDSSGKLQRLTLVDGKQLHFQYDKNGNLIRKWME